MEAGGWKEYFTAEGVPYYYNAGTGATSWDKPDVMKTEDEKDGTVRADTTYAHARSLAREVAAASTTILLNLPSSATLLHQPSQSCLDARQSRVLVSERG